jgi:predicted NAD/FAD-binding protein
MRIAVIGSGISGMVAAYHLSRTHDVTVYESGAHIGGHTNTVDVDLQGRGYAIDTGFIVYNDWTYQNFIKLLDELKVPWQPSHMSFSVRCEKSGLEYNGTSLNALFAQRRNLGRPSFLRMVADLVRFNARAPKLLEPGAPATTLREYLDREGYSKYFVDHYIIPMGAAIWSSRRPAALPRPVLCRIFRQPRFLERERPPRLARDSRRFARICQTAHRPLRGPHTPEHPRGLPAATTEPRRVAVEERHC